MAEDTINFQLPPEGFGSYLYDILPDDQAVLAGAFSTAMSQVRNLNMVDFQRFAQVVFALETNAGLPLTDGSDIPADKFIVDEALIKVALGSGVYGQYNMSDFFGCMSGLPLPLVDVMNGIQLLQTDKLENIYRELYLAVTWQQAETVVDYETRAVELTPYVPPCPYPTCDPPEPAVPATYQWQYKINSVTMADSGGGYGRSSAALPTGSFGDSGTGYYSGAGGATVSLTLDSNDANAPNTFGRLTLVAQAGTWVNYGVTGTTTSTPADPGIVYEIQAPPTAYTIYPYTGGVNTPYGTAGWPGMNTVVQSLIDDSNSEIYDIQTKSDASFANAKQLNILWNILGTTLKIQQRSRYILMPPVAIPHFDFLAQYPQNLITFIDGMPDTANDTEPHGPAQTVENSVDMCVIGGQSLIALMREQRNQQRLAGLGIPLDNNIINELTEEQIQLLLANGTLPGAVEGVPSPVGDFTIPAWSDSQDCAGFNMFPTPVGYYDPNLQGFRLVTPIFGNPGNRKYIKPGSITPITNTKYLGPYGDLTGPPLTGPSPYDNTGIITDTFNNPPPGLGTAGPGPTNLTDGPQIPIVTVGTNVPSTGGLPYNQGLGVGLPIELDPETGLPVVPSEVASVLEANLGGGDGAGPSTPTLGPGAGGAGVTFPVISELPPNLNPIYTASQLLPSTLSLQQAIDKVIECNCDCWVS